MYCTNEIKFKLIICLSVPQHINTYEKARLQFNYSLSNVIDKLKGHKLLYHSQKESEHGHEKRITHFRQTKSTARKRHRTLTAA